MTGNEMIKNRRSIRKYKDELVSREVLNELMETVKFAPSWANFQVARYTFVQNPETITKMMTDGVNGFAYNINTLKEAKNALVLSFVQGKSGKLDPEGDDYATSRANVWEVFDAGIACQTFCLAAHEMGIGTCIMGIIAAEQIKEIVKLPEEETVAALITFGYPDEEVNTTTRKEVSEIARFI
ncbi:MAG: nitroreductase family protein [Lachnospiraceae bacterium]